MNMKKIIPGTFITLILSATIFAQTNPAITSWIINTTNQTGYNCSGCTPAVNGSIPANVQSVYYTSTDAYISASGIPSYNIGPWASNPNVPANENKKWKITLSPTQNTGTKTT